MSGRERNLLIALFLVVLVSLPFWPIWGQPEGQGSAGSGPAGSPGGEESEQGGRYTPSMRVDLLDRRPGRFAGAQRNLFRYAYTPAAESGPAPEQQQQIAPQQTAAEIQQAQEQAAPRQLTGYEFLGYVDTDGRRNAAFLWEGQYLVGYEGSVINEVFRIERIEDNGVKIRVLDGDYEQTLALRRPSGNLSGGEGQ